MNLVSFKNINNWPSRNKSNFKLSCSFSDFDFLGLLWQENEHGQVVINSTSKLSCLFSDFDFLGLPWQENEHGCNAGIKKLAHWVDFWVNYFLETC